jgi:hypothetical protein
MKLTKKIIDSLDCSDKTKKFMNDNKLFKLDNKKHRIKSDLYTEMVFNDMLAVKYDSFGRVEFIEFDNEPEDVLDLAKKIDTSMQKQNSYYYDLIFGNVLQPLKISTIKKNGFQDYMKSIGKLGGQNKIPRLSNDRKIADTLYAQRLLK